MKDGKTGKNVDRYGKECYPKSKLRAAKRELVTRNTDIFAKSFYF
ncbi:MAG: hypothetical protein ACLU2Y_05695 [Blautia massiliensis (ex Durand et al. 2017)]